MKYFLEQNRECGFFSSFNIIVGCLKWLEDNSIVDFYIKWNNILYQTDNKNLFDKFFFNQKPIDNHNPEDIINIDTMKVGNIYEFIHNIELCKTLNKILIKYGHFDNPVWKKCNELCISRENSLGVHVRRTDHHLHGEFLDNDFYYEIIDNKLQENNYKNILLITDENKVVKEFVSKYGDLIMLNENIYRSDDENPIHYKHLENIDELAEQIMIEAISLSRCEEIIVTSSNVSGYSLMLNPQIKFEQIDKHIHYHDY